MTIQMATHGLTNMYIEILYVYPIDAKVHML